MLLATRSNEDALGWLASDSLTYLVQEGEDALDELITEESLKELVELAKKAGTFQEPYPFADKKTGKKCKQAVVTLWRTLLEKIKHEVRPLRAVPDAPCPPLHTEAPSPTAGGLRRSVPLERGCDAPDHGRLGIRPMPPRWRQPMIDSPDFVWRAGASWRAPH